jgi:hypothetical protein
MYIALVSCLQGHSELAKISRMTSLLHLRRSGHGPEAESLVSKHRQTLDLQAHRVDWSSLVLLREDPSRQSPHHGSRNAMLAAAPPNFIYLSFSRPLILHRIAALNLETGFVQPQ